MCNRKTFKNKTCVKPVRTPVHPDDVLRVRFFTVWLDAPRKPLARVELFADKPRNVRLDTVFDLWEKVWPRVPDDIADE